jgi:hypothetical protein
MWNSATQSFLTGAELGVRFKLGPGDLASYDCMVDAFPEAWRVLLTKATQDSTKGEFIGIFTTADDMVPSLIFAIQESFNPPIRPQPDEFHIPPGHISYVVGSRSKLLQPLDSSAVVTIVGILRRIWVVTTSAGTNKRSSSYLQYAGVIASLDFDRGRWHWANQLGVLHSYSVSKGRSQILQPRHQLQRPIGLKWHGESPANFTPSWKDIWLSIRPQKEVGFLWSVVHCAIAVNTWCAQINNRIPTLCTCCTTQAAETV